MHNGFPLSSFLLIGRTTTLIFLLSLPFTENVRSQDAFELIEQGPELVDGEPYERIRTRTAVRFYRFGEELISIKFSKNFYSVHIQKFSIPELKELDRAEASSPSRKVTPELVHSRPGEEGGLYILYSWRDKNFFGDDQEFLFHRELDRNTLSLSDTTRTFSLKEGVLLEAKTGVCGFLCFTGVDKYDFYRSRDDSALLGTFRLEEGHFWDPEDKASLRFVILDHDMELVWSGKGVMPYAKERMSHSGFLIGDDKRFHAIGSIDLPPEEKDGERDFSHFEILQFVPSKGKFIGKMVKSGKDRYIQSISISQTPSGRILCWGSYVSSQESDQCKGLFSFYIEKGLDFGKMRWYPFSLKHINLYEDEETREENKKKGKGHDDVGMKSLSVRNIFFESTGNIYLIAEESFSRYEMYYTDFNTNYYNNDIVVMKLTPDLKKKWVRVLPKFQLSTKPEHNFSFQPFALRSWLCLFYIDRNENLELSRDERPERIDYGGSPHAYLVSKDNGKVIKTTVFDPGERGYNLGRFGFDRIGKLDSTSLIMEASKGSREELLVKMNFDRIFSSSP